MPLIFNHLEKHTIYVLKRNWLQKQYVYGDFLYEHDFPGE